MGDTLSSLLRLHRGSCAAVVGAGGKTSIIELLAKQNQEQSVLITPTTKIWPMKQKNVTCYSSLASCLAHQPQNGVVCAGQLNPATGKLQAFRPQDLATLASRYTLVLLEADGSSGLPCKGWAAHEPVVPDFTTTTIGVLTLGGVKKTATKQYVHHLPAFLALTGLQAGEPIPLKAMAAMAASPQGMFKTAAGEIQLVINQVESPEQVALANQLICHIQAQNHGQIDRFIIGSAQLNRWQLAGK